METIFLPLLTSFGQTVHFRDNSLPHMGKLKTNDPMLIQTEILNIYLVLQIAQLLRSFVSEQLLSYWKDT